MKAFICCAFVICLFVQNAQAQVIRQQVNQNFSVVGVDTLVLDLDGEIVWRKSPGSRLLIELTIEAENATPSIMAVLTRSNRFKLTATLEKGVLTIAYPKNNPVVRVGDKIVREIISFKVYVPKSLW